MADIVLENIKIQFNSIKIMIFIWNKNTVFYECIVEGHKLSWDLEALLYDSDK